MRKFASLVGMFVGRQFFAGILACAALALAGAPAMGQLPLWSDGFAGTENATVWDVAVDGNGNIFMVGQFQGRIKFRNDFPELVSTGGTDLFLVKVSPTGWPLWQKQIGGANYDDVGFGVCTDLDGNVIITGKFAGANVNFGGGALVSSMGFGDIFVAKYTTNAAWIWHTTWSLGDAIGDGADYGRSVCTDAAGNIYITGCDSRDKVYYDFDDEVFLAKLNSNGSVAWQRTFTDLHGGDDQGNDVGVGICVHGTGSGALVTITGYFGADMSLGTIKFGDVALESNGWKDIFLATFYADSGNHAASTSFGSIGNDEGRSISASPDGLVLLAGYYSAQIYFGGASALTCQGGKDIFLAKLSAAGGHVWSKGLGAAGNDSGEDIAVDAQGAVVITGFFMRTVDFGGGPLTSNGYDPNFSDIFLAKYDSSGDHVWSRSFGSLGADFWGSCDEAGSSICLFNNSSGAQDVIFGGYYTGSSLLCWIDFGCGVLGTTGLLTPFLVKYTGDAGIRDVVVETTYEPYFDSETGTWMDAWDADITFSTGLYPCNTAVECFPGGNCFLSWYLAPPLLFEGGDANATQHSIHIEGMNVPSTEYVCRIKAWRSDAPWCLNSEYCHLNAESTFPLAASHPPIYNITHSFSSEACHIVVAWKTEFPSTDNQLYYRRTGYSTWLIIDAVQPDCVSDRTYSAVFNVVPNTAYEFKVRTKLEDQVFFSSVMNRTSAGCRDDGVLPQDSPARPAPTDPFVRAYPNPFNPTTTLSFNVPVPADISLTIYGIDGTCLITLASGAFDEGTHDVVWNGTNARGEKVSSGIYFVRFKYGPELLTSKIILLR